MRVGLYIRVSTQDQNCELQLRELRIYAGAHNAEIVQTYQDVMSGAKAHRPALDRLMADATKRKFECVMCCSGVLWSTV
jgi:putative DNA-invertase from lambdoid prophage Rac